MLQTTNSHSTLKKMDQDSLYLTTEAMCRFGGGFMRKLAEAIRVGDLSNQARILAAFPEINRDYGPGTKFYNSQTVNEEG